MWLALTINWKNYLLLLIEIIPLSKIIDPKIVKNKVSKPTKDKVPTTGRWIHGSCIVGSFNDSDGKNPENNKTSKIRITEPKNSKLPPKLITTDHEVVELINFFDKNLNKTIKHQSR